MTADPRSGENAPHPVDELVGLQIRVRRKALKMTQAQLAQALGITFQQVQKYERGANRVAASKLYDIAQALKTPIAFFFNETDHTGKGLHEMLTNPEGDQMVAHFPQLDPKVRRRMLALIKAIEADSDEEPEA